MFNGLKGKRVLITGASGGIGTAMARLFAAEGARLGIHYCRNERQARALCREVTRRGGEAVACHGDLLDPQACVRVMETFVKRFRGIDVLVNNAGAVFGPRQFATLAEASWDRTMALNARAPFLLAREAFRLMRRRGGKIINISSIAAKYGGSPETLHYGAAKAAMEAVTVGMARCGASHGILVNAIRAGFIETAFHRKIGRTQAAKRIQLIPLKRAGRPVEVARMALFLASRAGDYITGEILTVAGGD